MGCKTPLRQVEDNMTEKYKIIAYHCRNCGGIVEPGRNIAIIVHKKVHLQSMTTGNYVRKLDFWWIAAGILYISMI